MSIHVRCEVCGEEFRRPNSLAGKRERCPKCRRVLRVPALADAESFEAPLVACPADSGVPLTRNYESSAQEESPEPIAIGDQNVSVVREEATPAGEHGQRAVDVQDVPARKNVSEYAACLVASHSRQSEAIRRLGRFTPQHVLNARRVFAQEMTDDEVPLLFYDSSFFTNGKAGLLITDRAVYAYRPKRRIDLHDVRNATIDRPTMGQQSLHVMPAWVDTVAGIKRDNDINSHRLVINGESFYSRTASIVSGVGLLKACADLLNAIAGYNRTLGGVARHSASSSSALAEDEDYDGNDSVASGAAHPKPIGDPIAIAAGGLCSHTPIPAIVQDMIQAGLQADDADRIVQTMYWIHARSPGKSRHIVVAILGLLLVVLGIPGAGEFGLAHHDTLAQCCGALAAIGLFLMVVSLYRLVFGTPSMRVEELVAQWRKEQEGVNR
jgi:hypothetical protein